MEMSALGLSAVAVAAGVGPDEFHRLHEHAGRSATGVVDAAPIGLQHLDQQLDHAARGVELPALLALGAGELGQEVFVDAAEHVLGTGLLVAHLDVADEVDELTEPLLVEGGAGVVFGQHVLEYGIVALDAGHGAVDELADGGLARLGLEMGPAGLRRHPEDVLGDVFVAVLGSFGSPFGQNRRMALLEGVGDVFQKDEPQDDVLVFGRVHAAAQGVRHAPQLGLIACRGAVAAGLCEPSLERVFPDCALAMVSFSQAIDASSTVAGSGRRNNRATTRVDPALAFSPL